MPPKTLLLTPDSHPPVWRDHWPAGIAALVWLALAIHTVFSFFVTHDEFWHLPAGVRAWSGDFAVDRLNPPLSRLWAALPLRLCGVTLEPAADASALGVEFVSQRPDFLNWYRLGRLFHLIWPLLTAGLLYRWALELQGLWGARLALFCFLCCPNVLAHGSVITPDAPVMFGFLLTSYCLCRWMTVPTWRSAALVGVSLGALQGLKFTGVVFAPAVVAGFAWIMLRGGPVRRTVLWGQFAAIIGGSLFVLAAIYGFQGLAPRLDQLPLQSVAFRAWRQVLSPVASWPLPLPADYLLGIDQQRTVMEQRHPVFLDGVWREVGFWDYYPKTLLYKFGHGFQLLTLLGLACALWHRKSWSATRLIALWLPVSMLFAMATFSDMQLGVRYILPIVPLCALLAGHVANGATSWRMPLPAWLGKAAVALMLLSPLRFHPHHLAYFNEYAGGPIGGRQHLLDSNLDWGQDLLRARDYFRRHADEQPHVLYFGSVSPAMVGISAPLPPSGLPEPGLYLVSVNFVMGRPHLVWRKDGTSQMTDLYEFGYFRRFSAAEHLGYSIDVYRITEDDIRRVKPPGGNTPPHWNLPMEK